MSSSKLVVVIVKLIEVVAAAAAVTGIITFRIGISNEYKSHCRRNTIELVVITLVVTDSSRLVATTVMVTLVRVP